MVLLLTGAITSYFDGWMYTPQFIRVTVDILRVPLQLEIQLDIANSSPQSDEMYTTDFDFPPLGR